METPIAATQKAQQFPRISTHLMSRPKRVVQ
jgi:hypothetical protein